MSSNAVLQRRRRATPAELAQGQQEMERAQQRLEREAKASGELPIEDGEVEKVEVKGKKGGKKTQSPGHPGQQTPSTTTAPRTEDSHSKVTDSVSGRTPEIKGPPVAVKPQDPNRQGR